MAITLVPKAPGERVDYVWSPPIDDGDTIVGVATVNETSGTANLDSATVLGDSKSVRLWFTLGTDGETSRFDAAVTTIGGRTWQETFYLPVISAAKFGLTLNLVKQHLEYEDNDRDDLIAQYMRAAASWVESYTGKNLTVRTTVQTENCFGSYIPLNRAPFVSLTSIQYIDTSNAPQTLTGARTLNGRLYAPTAGWPAQGDYTSVTVTYQAGYDETPADLISAQLLLIADMFAGRESNEWKSTEAVRALCQPYRAMII